MKRCNDCGDIVINDHKCPLNPENKPTKEYVCENCGVEVDSKGIEIKNPTDPFMHNPILKEHKHKWVKYFEKGGQIGRGWIYLCECGDTKPFKPTKECKHEWVEESTNCLRCGKSRVTTTINNPYQELENKVLDAN